MVAKLISEAFTFLFLQLLDQDTRDIMIDAAEAHLARKDRVEGRKLKRDLAWGALATVRSLSKTPDEPEETDQEHPI